MMAKNNGIDWRIMVAGIAGIVVVESIALFMGVDGIVLTAVVGALALAIGVVIPAPKIK